MAAPAISKARRIPPTLPNDLLKLEHPDTVKILKVQRLVLEFAATKDIVGVTKAQQKQFLEALSELDAIEKQPSDQRVRERINDLMLVILLIQPEAREESKDEEEQADLMSPDFQIHLVRQIADCYEKSQDYAPQLLDAFFHIEWNLEIRKRASAPTGGYILGDRILFYIRIQEKTLHIYTDASGYNTLGYGRYSEVYKMIDVVTRADSIFKLIVNKQAVRMTEEESLSFRQNVLDREVEALKLAHQKLHSPPWLPKAPIVPFFAKKPAGDTWIGFFAGFLPGRTLKSLLNSFGFSDPMREKTCYELLDKATQLLQAGIAHADCVPDNLLQAEELAVIDFGIAKVFSDPFITPLFRRYTHVHSADVLEAEDAIQNKDAPTVVRMEIAAEFFAIAVTCVEILTDQTPYLTITREDFKNPYLVKELAKVKIPDVEIPEGVDKEQWIRENPGEILFGNDYVDINFRHVPGRPSSGWEKVARAKKYNDELVKLLESMLQHDWRQRPTVEAVARFSQIAKNPISPP